MSHRRRRTIVTFALALTGLSIPAAVQAQSPSGGADLIPNSSAAPVVDFNSDGFADLAIGSPLENFEGAADAGAVNVLYGAAAGVTTLDDQFFRQGLNGVLDAAEAGDRFGSSLAMGDFNGDSFTDLAIGVPLEDVGGVVDAGAVQVLYGSTAGLTTVGNQFLNQSTTGSLDAAEAGDQFGAALAAANFGGTSHADLAVGIPLENVGAIADAGAVHVLDGSATGLTTAGDQFLHQNSSGVVNTAESGDRFGSALAAANLGRTSEADLAVGIPREDIGTIADAGAVQAIYGSAGGLTSTGNQLLSQSTAGTLDTAERGDRFGAALAAANLGKTSHADLAVGIPLENVGAIADAGAVHVLYGTASGLTTAGDQFLHQNSAGILTTAESGDRFGSALAAANLGHSSHADLAVGIPLENVGTIVDAGAVHVIYGSSGGLTTTGDQVLTQNTSGTVNTAERGDRFGAALAAANMGGTTHADLAVGIPLEDVSTFLDAGAVHVLYGSANGVSTAADQLFHQGTPGILDGAEAGDRFGSAVSARR